MPEFSIEEIREHAVRCLTRYDISAEDAGTLVDHMLTADMCGRASHGLGVRFEMIRRQAEEGRGEAPYEIVSDNGPTVAVDGHNGFGYLQGKKAVELLVERARAHHICAAALRNTGHTGMLGYYAARGAEAGIVTMGFGDCTPLMAPYGGSRALLGTNPLAIGFPVTSGSPIVLDLGTSAITAGERKRRAAEGEALPRESALGPDGEVTADPEVAADGCLLPFGGARGGALAVAVQLLAGVLTGSPGIPERGKGYGLLLIGVREDAFCAGNTYEEEMNNFIEAYLNVPAREGGEVRLPGSRAAEAYQQAKERGTVAIPSRIAELIGLKA